MKNDPYTFKKSTKILDRDNFYEQKQQAGKKNESVDRTIHQKMTPYPEQK